MALYLQETGSVTAPTIVFLHGGGGAGWMWQPQVEQLSDFHCLVPDLPEQGQAALKSRSAFQAAPASSPISFAHTLMTAGPLSWDCRKARKSPWRC